MAISPGFSTAVSALHANQLRMATASNNISNAQTEGYNRQRVDVTFSQSSPEQGVRIGDGARVRDVNRMVDDFMIREEIDQTGKLGTTKTRSELASRLDGFFDEPEGGGISGRIQEFFRKVSDLSNNPGGDVERTQVLSMGRELSKLMSDRDTQLSGYQKEIDDRVTQKLRDINNSIRQIADLNIRIGQVENGTGQEAMALRDQRDQLTRELSEKIGINYYEDNQGSYNIQMKNGGHSLVNKGEATTLSRGLKTEGGAITFSGITLDDGVPKELSDGIRDGEIGAMLRIRDETIPELRGRLDDLAQSMIGEVNKVHAKGVGLEYQDSARASMATGDPTAQLQDEKSSKLPFGELFQAGQVDFAVHNKATGQIEMVSVQLDGNEVLEDGSSGDIVSKINRAVGDAAADSEWLSAGDLQAGLSNGHLELKTSEGVDFALKSGPDGREQIKTTWEGSVASGGQLQFRVRGPGGEVSTSPASPISYGSGAGGADIAEAINAAGSRVSANWNASKNELTLSAPGGYEIEVKKDTGSFMEDAGIDGSSNLFAAVGINTFFTLDQGQNVAEGVSSAAGSMKLDPYVEGSPERVHAGHLGARLSDAGEPRRDSNGEVVYEIGVGDNSAALDMLDLQSAGFEIGGGKPRTFGEHYAGTISRAGAEKANADSLVEFQQRVMDQIKEQRESVSGVNTEEELVRMMNFQRGYQAASKVISSTDRMFQSLLQSV
ncbi:flagellar hook-associated protein FlgK [Thiohalorhabdus methylotrophus]|uniref:Flagellar hook-associated protein 1 n=1 Tax=Thiohalorhabdus methylotrophus TaxID=3242694 RepID=A0ABV4TVY6_9GAMM